MMRQGQLFTEDNPASSIDTLTAEQHISTQVNHLATREGVLDLLEHWLNSSWIRALDVALVKLLAKLDPNAEP